MRGVMGDGWNEKSVEVYRLNETILGGKLESKLLTEVNELVNGLSGVGGRTIVIDNSELGLTRVYKQ